jgi:tetratricopeptide (TPR) repeat protein
MKSILVFFVLFLSINIFGQSSKDIEVTYNFIEALKNKEFGDLKQAAYLFKKCYEYDSKCAACYYEYSLILKSVGDFNSALKYSDSAAILDNQNYWYLQNRIENLMALKKYKEAEFYYADLIKKDLAKLDDKYDYANVCFVTGNDKEALNTLNQLEKENGISEIISLAKYRFYISKRKFKLAENEINKLLNVQPENYELYGILAELLAVQKKDKEALEAYNTYLANDKNDIIGNLSIARFYISRKKFNEAEKHYDVIFKNDSVPFVQKYAALDNILKNGFDKFTVNYVNREFQSLNKKYPDNDTLMQYEISFYAQQKLFDSAFNVAENLVSNFRDSSDYWERLFYFGSLTNKDSVIISLMPQVEKKFKNNAFLNLVGGMAYFNKADYKDAIKVLNAGIDNASNPQMQKQYIVFLADSYYKEGIKDTAYIYYEIGISKDSADVSLLNNYAYYLSLDSKDLNKALKMSEETIKKEPKNSFYLDTYAWVLYKLKNYKLALKYIKLADKYSNNRSADVKAHYGDILYCNGDKEKAAKYWKEAFDLGMSKDEFDKKLKAFMCE